MAKLLPEAAVAKRYGVHVCTGDAGIATQT